MGYETDDACEVYEDALLHEKLLEMLQDEYSKGIEVPGCRRHGDELLVVSFLGSRSRGVGG